MNDLEIFTPYVEDLLSAAKEDVENNDLFPSAFVLFRRPGEKEIVGGAIPFKGTSPVDKEITAAGIKMIAKKVNAEAIIIMMPGYILEQENAHLYKKPIVDHPNRKEVIFVSLETHNGLWFDYMPIEIIKGVRTFRKLNLEMRNGGEGRFVGLMPQSPISH